MVSEPDDPDTRGHQMLPNAHAGEEGDAAVLLKRLDQVFPQYQVLVPSRERCLLQAEIHELILVQVVCGVLKKSLYHGDFRVLPVLV